MAGIEQIIGIKIETEAANKSLEELQDDFELINKELKKLSENGKEGTDTFKKLTKQSEAYGKVIEQRGKTLGGMNENLELMRRELDGLEVGSDAFNVLSREVTEAERDIKNLELSMESLDNEQVASEIGSVAGAVGDVSAAFILLGDDSESLQEVAQNIETALGVSMAFKGAIEGISSARKLLNNSTIVSTSLQKANTLAVGIASAAQKAFNLSILGSNGALKLFRLAILGTGIGVLIAGLGLLIANFDKVVGAVKNAVNWLGKVTGFIEEVDAATVAAAAAQRDLAEETIEANQKIIESNRNRTQELVDGLDFEIRKRRANGEETAEIERAKLNLLIESNKKELELMNQNIEALEDNAKKKRGVFARFKKKDLEDEKKVTEEAQKKVLQDLEIFEIEQAKIERDAAKKRRDERKKEHDKEVEDERKKNDRIKQERQKALELLEKLKKDFELRNLNDQDREIEELRIKLNQELTIAENDYNLQLKLKEEFEENKKAIEDKYRVERVASEKEAQTNIYLAGLEALQKTEADNEADREKKKQDRIDEFNDKLSTAQELNNSLRDLNNAVLEAQLAAAGDNEEKVQEIRRKAFRREKALNIAQATINGAQAVLKAASSPLPFIAVPFAAGIAAANIAKISKSKFQGESGDASPTEDFESTVSATGGANVPQVTNTTTTIGEPTKVFVTEQDISNTQNRVTVAEQQGTL